MRLYRVLYHLDSAAPTEKGGVLYVPPQTGLGRIDNPNDYEAFYLGSHAAGVCAEVFYRGKFRIQWNDEMLAPLPNRSRRVLAWYELADDTAICDLNNVDELLTRGLQPADILTRDYSKTQQWALDIFRENRYAGISWWSYCDARWTTYGLWDRTVIKRHGIEELSLAHPAITEAANVLDIAIVTGHA